MSEQSIYSVICESINSEGKLPHNFWLPFNETPPNKLSFMPGAKDGIEIFHMNLKNPDKVVKKIVKLLKDEWKKNSSKSQGKISELLQNYGTLSIIDSVLESIRESSKDINIANMFEYACQLAFNTSDEELVKLGIGLLGLLDLSNEQDTVDKLLKLALYEEFTLYVVVAVLNYQNGNDILFRIAQKVDGWGKIHTVMRLEPATDEIREWILRKGCANAIVNAYLGLECANKGDLIGALRGNSIDDELFEGISIIIDALLDEGPADGISVYEHAEEALQRYLSIASERTLTIIQFWRILNLKQWLEDAQLANRDELIKMCDGIVCRDSWQNMILEILKNPDDSNFRYATDIARKLNMNVSELIFNAVKKEPVKHFGYLYLVYKNPRYAKELTKIYENILPLDDMATGMGDFLFAKNFSQEHNCLDFVLQELKNYPQLGEKLVKTALKSPVVRERNGACRVLEEWCKKLNQNLQNISPDLFSLLKEIEKIEVNADTKEKMKNLLKNKWL